MLTFDCTSTLLESLLGGRWRAGNRNRKSNQKRRKREGKESGKYVARQNCQHWNGGVGSTGFPRKDRRSWEYELPEPIGKNRRMGNSPFLDGSYGECLQLLLPFFLQVVELLCRVGGQSGKVQQIALQALTSRYYKPPSWGWTGLFGTQQFTSRQLASKKVSIFLPFFL